MVELNQYLSQTQYIPDLKVDMGFLLSDSFYYGDDNEWTEEEYLRLRQPLEKPALELYGKYALSEDVEGKEQALVKHYASVVQATIEHKKPRKAGDHYFWLRPVVFHKEVNAIYFPWYDTLAEALPFLEALANNEEGWIFEDLDQGWQVAVHAAEDKFYFINRHWEEDRLLWSASGDRAALSSMAKQCLVRIKKQVALLTTQLGTDYWTQREKRMDD